MRRRSHQSILGGVLWHPQAQLKWPAHLHQRQRTQATDQRQYLFLLPQPDRSGSRRQSDRGVYKLDAASTSLFNEGSMLATYDMQSNGSLTTTSKYNNMPWVTEVGELEDLQMSPSGKFIAVAGGNGLIVRHANGDHPPTRYTGLLTSDLIGQTFWDNANHLYAVSLYGRLHVYTITADSYSEAPGSPYSIPAGGFDIPMIVRPLTH